MLNKETQLEQLWFNLEMNTPSKNTNKTSPYVYRVYVCMHACVRAYR